MTASIMNHLEIEMTNDNDLIRRGDALAIVQSITTGHYDPKGWLQSIVALPVVAASQTADPVTNADSRQRVMVKPLVWEEVNPGVFVAESSLGVWSRFDGHYMRPDASGGIASDNPEAAAQADYAARIMSAIDVHPDPRDAQIAALVEAAKALEMWDAARGYPVPYRVRDPLRAALAAVKGDNRE